LSLLAVSAAALALPGEALRADSRPAPPELRGFEDRTLQAALERVVEGLGLARAVEKRHLALALVDMTDETPHLAMLNGDEMMYAASLPKIAILLGAFVQAERGRLVLDEPTVGQINRMIRYSSNEDASAVLAKVGEAALVDILTSPAYHFYDARAGGGLWVGKSYGRAAAYRRDPVAHLSHGATAYQVARFYYLLDRGLLLSPELTRQMRGVLADPGIRHKFVKGLESRPEVKLFRKSGTWRQFHSDSALVEGPNRRYVLVGLADQEEGGGWLVRLALPVDDLIDSRHPAALQGAATR
jgi:beta-lactamase class A